jgi:hypothetical protein
MAANYEYDEFGFAYRPDVDREITFAEAFFGLLLEPRLTTKRLLSKEPPPYIVGLFCLTLGACFGPIMFHYLRYNTTIFRPEAVVSLAVTFFFTIAVFILLETILLFLFQVEASVHQVAACVAYSLSPFTFIILIFYTLNFLQTGTVSLITILLGGASSPNDPFMKMIPYATLLAFAIIVIVFLYGLSYIGNLHFVSLLLLLTISIPVFYAALKCGLFIGDLARPGTTETLLNMISSPGSITYFGGRP